MKVLSGISSGMVLQRSGDVCDIRFRADTTGTVRSSIGSVKDLGNGLFRLSGIPCGGPYELTLADETGELLFSDLYVGDVWILAGQSNMTGVACRRKEDFAYDENPIPAIRACYLDDSWSVAHCFLHQQWMNKDEGIRQRYYETHQGNLKHFGRFTIEGTSGIGPGIYIGRRMYELTGIPQGLIPCAFGGTNLDDWSPDNHTSFSMYDSMLRRFRENGSHAAGVFWYQGEAQSSPEHAETFTADMQKLISAIRRDFGDSALPFVQAQIAVSHTAHGYEDAKMIFWHKIRELQRNLPEVIPGCYTVSTANATFEDSLHIDARSQEMTGRTMAEQMYLHYTGKGALVPSIEDISVIPHPHKYNMSLIRIKYRNLIGSLRSDGQPSGFSVTSGDAVPFNQPHRNVGSVRVEGSSVYLGIENAIVTVEDAYLWYGAGPNIVCTLLDEGGRALPAFGPVKITGTQEKADHDPNEFIFA